MAVLPPNNALAWAHFRLRGGWTRSLTWTGGAMALLVIVILSLARVDPLSSTRTYFGWASGLLALQALCWVIFIPGRISTTIRQDLTSRMIESHRLMPLPPGHAVAGYILGAAAQPLIFSAGVFIVGGLTAIAGNADWRTWLFAHAVLLIFAGFTWVLCAYITLGAKVGAGILFLPLMIPYLSGGGVLALLPGATVLLSPIIGRTIFDLRNTGFTLPGAFAMAIAAQVAVGAICFIAATRKYRSSDSIGTDTVLAICLLSVWSAVSFAGLRAWDDFRPRDWSLMRASVHAQVVGSVLVGMLVAATAVSASALERVRFRRHAALRDPAPIRKPWGIAAVIVAATGVILLIPLAPKPPDGIDLTAGRMAQSGAIIGFYLIGIYFLFDWCYSTLHRAGWIIFLWLLLTWGAPIAVDLIRYGLAESGEIEPIGAIGTMSPAGALIALWTGRSIDTLAGIAIQGLIALAPGILWLTMQRRQRRPLAGA